MTGKKEFCPYCMSATTPGEPCKNCGLTAGAYTPAPHHLPPGTVLRERYLIGRVLGEGGFGITYIGCDLRLELKVAIKEYFPTDRANRVSLASMEVTGYSGAAGSRFQEGKTRFLEEARTMAKMDKQPVIVSVRDFFESNNTAYIVMEYVEGVTFKDLVAQRGGRIPAGSLLHTVEPLFSALSAMHSLGLIHRDISPENLMLENGEIRLLDFGCARESQGGDATVTIALKQGYAPVEQYQNKGQGPWTDVYALSATIYYCLTGQKPPQSMDRLMEDELVPPRRMGADLTEKQEKALLYGMGVRPRRRFQSVEELHTALYEGIEWDGEPDSITEEPPPSPTPPGTTEPPPAPGPTGETEPPPTGPAVEEHPGVPGKPRLPWGRGRVIGGACAAVAAIILVVVLALQPWKPRDVPVEPAAGPVEPTPAAESPAPPSSQPEESSEAPVGADFSGAVNAESEEQLRQLMEDDAVTAIKIDTPGWNLKVMEPLEVRKPLLAKTGLHLYAPLTVDGCGLRVEQGLYGSVFVRAQNGGSITAVNEDSVQCAMLWLDNEEDLQMEGGGSYRGSVVVADEEELFKDAAHVTTIEEFEEAIRTP